MLIKKSIFNKALLFILVFTILFNFISIPKKVHAEVISMSYGLYIFLQAAYAAGLTYIVADKVTDSGIKLYQEWQKFNEQKPDPPDDNDQKNALANLLGLGIADGFKNLIDNIKDFFVGIGAKEGVNEWKPDIDHIHPDTSRFNYYDIDTFSNDSIYTVYFAGNIFKIEHRYSDFSGKKRLAKIFVTMNDLTKEVNYPNGSIPYGTSVTIEIIADTIRVKTDRFQTSGPSFIFPYVPNSDNGPPKPLEYNINKDSYISTDNSDNKLPVYPNIDILPKEKFEMIATPDGYYERYVGDDLVDDYIEAIPNISPNDLFENIPGEFVETDYGIIWLPEGSPIPNPSPAPNPNPNPNPYPKPNPDPQPDPYPDPQPEDVEIPKGLGQIILLLKELINWSSKIFNKDIDSVDPEDPDKPGLFEIPDNLQLNLDPLKNLSIVEKFPFSLPWDLKNAVNLLVSPGEPPSWEVPILDENITIDLSEFESLAVISRSFFTILFIIALIIATRRFIGGA